MGNAIFHRAREVVTADTDPAAAYRALREDPGLRSILESSLYSKNVTFAAIVDVKGLAVAAADPAREGGVLPASGDLAELVARSALSQLRAIYRGQGQNLEFRQTLRLGDTDFGSIRIGVSTLLIRQDLGASLGPAAVTAGVALALAVVGAMLLAQLLLRPIHVIRSGLTRLGRGEEGVRLDLGEGDEFGELGTLLQHRQRAAVGRPIAHGRPSGEPRVGRAVPRRRSCHHQPARRAAVRQPGHAGAVAGRDARDLARTPRRRQPSASRVGRADAREPRLERAGFGAFP